MDTKLKNGITMDEIMNSSFGEVSNRLEVTYKKTVLVRQYETEVIEATTEVKLDEPVSAIERMFITTLLEIQMEYSTFCSLRIKGLVTQTEFEQRKDELEKYAYSVKYKAEQILGKGAVDKYLKYNFK